MPIKPDPKRITKSTGEPDKRLRDNIESPGNTPSLKPPINKKGKYSFTSFLRPFFEIKKFNLAID